MKAIVCLFALFYLDEPRPTIDDGGIRIFIESHRPDGAGPGKVVATSSGWYDSDSYADKIAVFYYERKSTSDHWSPGMYAVAFFTENFGTSDILFIPASDIIPESVHQYSSNGMELRITGKRHIPGDDECCPSAIASLTLSVEDGDVVVLRGGYRKASKRN